MSGKPSAIYVEWERLVFHTEPWPTSVREPSADLVAGWRRLYESVRTEQGWICDIDDARLVATLGSMNAFRQRNYEYQAALLIELFKHPSFGEFSSNDRIHVQTSLGTALVLSGNLHDGVEQWRASLTDQSHGKVSRLRSVLLNVGIVLEEEALATADIASLRDFVAEILRSHRKPGAAAKVSKATNGQELFVAIEAALRRL